MTSHLLHTYVYSSVWALYTTYHSPTEFRKQNFFFKLLYLVLLHLRYDIKWYIIENPRVYHFTPNRGVKWYTMFFLKKPFIREEYRIFQYGIH